MAVRGIAFSGKIASGKTTCAEALAAQGFQVATHSFAGSLKGQTRAIFETDSREKTVRNRRILQEFGAACREIQPGIWLRHFYQRLPAGTTYTVIVDDLRFPDEATFLYAIGFKLVRLESCDDDERVARACRLYGYHPDDDLFFHDSETALDDYPAFDAVIVSATPEQMLAELGSLAEHWLPKQSDLLSPEAREAIKQEQARHSLTFDDVGFRIREEALARQAAKGPSWALTKNRDAGFGDR